MATITEVFRLTLKGAQKWECSWEKIDYRVIFRFLITAYLPIQYGYIWTWSTPEPFKARAIAPFHEQNGRCQLFSFNEVVKIGVFADSLNSKEGTDWWHDFRFANGPSRGIGKFRDDRVSLFPLLHRQQQSQENSAVRLRSNKKKGKIGFRAQADVTFNWSFSDENGENETNGSSETSQKAENSIISNGIDNTLPQNGSECLQKIDALVPTAMPVLLRSPATNTSAKMAIEAGNITNLLINFSNQNSGLGSAYATSSER